MSRQKIRAPRNKVDSKQLQVTVRFRSLEELNQVKEAVGLTELKVAGFIRSAAVRLAAQVKKLGTMPPRG